MKTELPITKIVTETLEEWEKKRNRKRKTKFYPMACTTRS